jgi:hypothetical protein
MSSRNGNKGKIVWTTAEDDLLFRAVELDKQQRGEASDDDEDWDTIARSVPGKTPVQCLKRYLVLNRDSSFEAAAAAEEGEDEEQDSKHPAKPEKRTGQKRQNDDDGKEPSSAASGRETKKVRTSKAAVSTSTAVVNWSHDEIRLLMKLVDQYKDCK